MATISNADHIQCWQVRVEIGTVTAAADVKWCSQFGKWFGNSKNKK